MPEIGSGRRISTSHRYEPKVMSLVSLAGLVPAVKKSKNGVP